MNPTPAPTCACSRRPGENNSFQCPPGTGKTVTVVVDGHGGTLTLDGTPATLGVPFEVEIPPGALTQPVALTVTETTTAPPDAYTDFSPVFDLAPHGLALAIPAKLILPETNAGGWSGAISIYLSTDGGSSYGRISDSYQNAGFAESSLSTLGPVFVGYPRDAGAGAACRASGG
jgi:hypothetical protein